ncbi:MAG: GNAT family N-acetyltransferase [Pseudomonadota bacterium]
MIEQIQLSLETRQLALRVMRETDLPNVYQLHSIDVVNQYLPYQTWQGYQDALDWYEKVKLRRATSEAEQFVIIERGENKLIGTIIVFGFDKAERTIEVGYVLHPDHWGQGLMQEALQSFLSVLEKALSLSAVQAVVEQPNTASLKLLSKLDFTHINTRVDEQGIRLEDWIKVF